MKLRIEIRPGEGGEDARLLVKRQAAIYLAFATVNKLQVKTDQNNTAG